MITPSASNLVVLAALLPGAFAAAAQNFTPPSTSPFAQSKSYVGRNNGTIVNTPLVKGAQFDRFIQIFLENTNYNQAAASPIFQKLASKGLLFTDSFGVAHPSQPNYVAAVGGSMFGDVSDDTAAFSFPPINEPTIVDLLEKRNISWASYAENLPYVGYGGVDYSSHNYVTPGAADYAYYVRRHVGLAMYSTIMDVPHRRNRLRNFNDFAVDVSANKLPQWMFITPNILNDGHDTTIDYAGEWLDYWLVPLLADKRFNSDRTLVIVTFDEAEIPSEPSQVYTIAMGHAVPAKLVGKTDNTHYTHYSLMSTVENNWKLGNLGQGDATANVFSFVANVTGYKNDKSDGNAIPGTTVQLPAPIKGGLNVPSAP